MSTQQQQPKGGGKKERANNAQNSASGGASKKGGGGKTSEKQSKGGGGAGTGKQQKEQQDQDDVKRDQKLQAILLADSFSKAFRPITLESPKVLLPLVNVPMLEYTIEFLAQNGVEEIIVFCVWHAETLQSYINSSKWPSLIQVRCISSAACLSAGDALRELDALNIIRSDPFILISGDVISNLNLKKAIAFHRQKRKEDSNNAMTVVLKNVQKTAGAKPILDDLIVAMDRGSSQILVFEDSHKKQDVRIPLELMMDRTGLSFHTNLLDCHVDICSPELMVQFSDNFDYQDIRRDFIRNEVGNVALGKHIYGYVIQNEYAARVQDPRSYHFICRDIVTRWVFPLVPDAQLLQDSSYTHAKQYTYREQGVKVSRSAQLGEGVVLGQGTVVHDDAILRRAIVGRDCSIGSGAKVVESHIWKGAVIEDNASVTQSIVCDGAVIKRGAVVPRGCLISYGAVVGENVVLPEFARISAKFTSDSTASSSSLSSSPEYHKDVLGPDGVGYAWKATERIGDYDNQEEEDDQEGPGEWTLVDSLHALSIGCREEEAWKRSLWRKLPLPEEDDYEAEQDNAGEQAEAAAAEGSDFQQIVTEMVASGFAEGHPAESLLLEIKGLKFAQNKSFSECVAGIVPSLISIAVSQSSGGSGSMKASEFVKNLKELVATGGWGHRLLSALIQAVTDEHPEAAEELELIKAVEDAALGSKELYAIFRFILQIFYESDLLTEDGITQWAEDKQDEEDASRLALFQEPAVQAFVAWINDNDDEEEEGGEDDDDDEEEGGEDDDDDDEEEDEEEDD